MVDFGTLCPVECSVRPLIEKPFKMKSYQPPFQRVNIGLFMYNRDV